MKYGDFSSVVQLGVGLHVGTAILQMYGELGVAPLVRVIARIRSLFVDEREQPTEQVRQELSQLESDFEIFKIRLFHEYKKYIKVNTVVAFLLTVLLIIIAYKADDPITDDWLAISVAIVSLSALPAPITFFCLWFDASRLVSPMKTRGD